MPRKKVEEIFSGEENVTMEEETVVNPTTLPEEDPRAEVFPGGPPKGQVDQWKMQFGEVFASTIDTDTFVWRSITRNEYKQILQIPKADNMYREERICERCVLWPLGYNHLAMINGKAGTPSLLAEQILDKSGFVPTGEPERL